MYDEDYVLKKVIKRAIQMVAAAVLPFLCCFAIESITATIVGVDEEYIPLVEKLSTVDFFEIVLPLIILMVFIVILMCIRGNVNNDEEQENLLVPTVRFNELSYEEQMIELGKMAKKVGLSELSYRLGLLVNQMELTDKDDTILRPNAEFLSRAITQLINACHRLGTEHVKETETYTKIIEVVTKLTDTIKREVVSEVLAEITDADTSIKAIDSMLNAKGYTNQKMNR